MLGTLCQSVFSQTDTSKYKASTKPTYNFEDRQGSYEAAGNSKSPLISPEPTNITRTVELSEDGKFYIIKEKIGDIDYRPPTVMSFEQYQKYKAEQDAKNSWKQISEEKGPSKPDTGSNSKSNQLLPKINMGPKADRIFGGDKIDIKPAGNVSLDFGGNFQHLYNPQLPARVQRSGGFVFNQSIMLNLQGKIGEKLTVGINWDTKAAFDFDNKIKLSYQGLDHDIIKSVEAGNVSMPLNSTFISGPQNLFGIKTKMQFGKLTVTAVAANQRSKNETITIPCNSGSSGAATGKDFEVSCLNYEENRHYFLSQIFREHYEAAFSTPPLITSPYQITRCEVYVTNRNSTTKNVRNFLALQDLGEYNPYLTSLNTSGNSNLAENGSNGLFNILKTDEEALRVEGTASPQMLLNGFKNTSDFEIVNNSRLLEENKDYKINKQLGYISLNQTLDQSDVLAVAFEYTYNGKTYKVGEFSQDLNGDGDATRLLFLKLLKSSTLNSALYLPMWNLMMKNVYNLGVTNVNKTGFDAKVVYYDDATKLSNPAILEGEKTANVNLLTLFNSDRLNVNNENLPDGIFDFIDKVTIDPDYGRLYFPVLEPFGSKLKSFFNEETEQALIRKYVLQELYDTTKQSLTANKTSSKTKFYIKGRIQSGTSGEIALSGLNISASSIKVIVGSKTLTQGTEYTVSADGSKIIISPEVLASCTDIKITFEKADLVQFRSKSVVGSRFDYAVSKDINLGGTFMHANERPNITRVNLGDEPIRNTMLGFDVNYKKESRLITKIVDKLPLISTKAPSNVVFNAEYATLLPGNSKVIGKDGNSFIDDFEGTRTPYDLTKTVTKWKIGSPPTSFTNGASTNDLSYGYKRAKLAWYNIDNSFFLDGSGGSAKPQNITSDDIDNYQYTRRVGPVEIFPNKTAQQGQFTETTFDLAYFPEERGPYNFQTALDANGLLPNPKQNFASITRAIAPGMDTDFDNINVQYLDFWLMDPFIDASNNGGVRAINPKTGLYETQENTTGGKLYFNLGNISEDVLYDNKQAFENGLPENGDKTTDNTDYNNWGAITKNQFIIDNFSNASGARQNQDIGLDGLKSTEENTYYSSYLNSINTSAISSDAKNKILNDPSADDFVHYLDSKKDDKKIIDRYKDYNGLEGNSPDNSQSTGAYVLSATNLPDNEDLNKNNTIETEESYFEYMVSLKKQDMQVGKNFIINKLSSKSADGKPCTWYQFRIPLRDTLNAKIIGNASMKSVRFMRMYLTDFEQPVVLRFAQFQMIASQWRPQPEALNGYLPKIQEELPSDEGFTVSSVNIEENGSNHTSISSKYEVPPGLVRDYNNNGINNNQLLNEQSLRMCVDDLKGGYIRYATKDFSTTLNSTGINLINFHKLKMFLHAESAQNPTGGKTDNVKALVRFGTDLTDNYYEVEIPLKLSNVTVESQAETWPTENELDVTLSELSALKTLRKSNNPNTTNPQSLQEKTLSDGKIYRVLGNPDLTKVKLFMIGLYHPDTLSTKSYCIWADELRLNGFNKSVAHTVTANLNMSLADFATVSLSGNYKTAGFGGVDTKVSERSTDEIMGYTAQTNVQVHKMLPQKLGLKLPLTLSKSENLVIPKYDPANPDVLLKESMKLKDNPEEYKKMVITKSSQKGIALTNVQKIKTNPKAKKHIYDIENITVTGSYLQTNNTSYKVAKNQAETYTGQATYSYSLKAVNFEPFKKPKTFNSKYLKLIKDFNVSPLPSSISVRAQMVRYFSETQNRNANLDTVGVKPIFYKYWNFDRYYNVKWSLTKSLTTDYLATAKAVIDEPTGRIGNEIDAATGQEKREIVKQSLSHFGRVKSFDQSLNTTYKLPFDKLPLLDWVGADVNYKLSYLWQANASKSLADTLGNTVQNGRNIGVNGKIDFSKLYNKSKFLKKINNPPPKTEPVKKTKYVKRADGKIDTIQVVVPEYKVVKSVLRRVMSLKNINVSFSDNRNTSIPGYMPTVKYLGFDDKFLAPGIPFMLGSQDVRSFLNNAKYNNDPNESWITTDKRLTQNIQQSIDQKLNITTAIEPIKDFKITINATKNKQNTFSMLYKDTLNDGQANFSELLNTRTGNYDVTIISLSTAFQKNGNSTFEQFKANRAVIHERLNSNPEVNATHTYADNSAQVLIPSFISAYTGKTASSTKLSPFVNIPMPNWNVTYSGLSNLKIVKKYIPSLTINHGYKSVYKVNSYTSSSLYTSDNPTKNEENYNYLQDNIASSTLSDTLNFVARYIVNDVQITENFSPLIGFNAKTKKNITFEFSVNKNRTVSLSTTNQQITEVRGKDFKVGVGYSKTGLKLPAFLKSKGRPIVLKNLTTMKLNITIRDNITYTRKMDQESMVTAGQANIQIQPNITYQVSSALNVQLYYNRTGLIPYTSGSFKNVNTTFGFKLTFNLAEVGNTPQPAAKK